MNSPAKTFGGVGIRYDDKGTLYVGVAPSVRMHYEREEEYINSDGEEDVRGLGVPSPVIDMQPSIVSSADLINALIVQNDAGKAVEFLGHVRVIPTDVDATVNLT